MPPVCYNRLRSTVELPQYIGQAVDRHILRLIRNESRLRHVVAHALFALMYEFVCKASILRT